MADGSFKIKTEIDVKQAENSLSTLQNRFLKISDKIKGFRDRLHDVERTKLSSEEYDEITNAISKSEAELNKLLAKKAQMEDMGKTSGSAWETMRYKIDELKSGIAEMQSELNQSASGTALENTILRLKSAVGSLPTQLKNLAVSLPKKAFSALGNAVKVAGDKLKGAFVSGCKSAISNVKKLASTLGGKVLGAFKNLRNASEKTFNLKTLLKYAFGIRSLFVLFNRLRGAVVEGMNNLAQFNDGVNPVNASLSRLKSSLTQLKNSLATAFAPILTTIEPILTKLINKLSQAVTMVGMFIAKLTGAKSFTKAVAVQQNYAESLSGTSKGMDKTAKSAKKAQKAVEGYLSPIDEINKMTKQNDDSDESILPDVTDAGGGLSPNDMFETVTIPDEIGNLVDKLKEMWANADFTELGAMLGQKLKDMLDGIPWDYIKETAYKIGKSFATLINGFVEVDGLGKTIGKTIGEALNTVVNLINGFVTNLHWKSIGQFLADGFNSLVETIDWAKIGNTISESIKGLLDLFITTIEEIDWVQFGEKVAEMLENIDWGGIIERVFEAIGAVLGGLAGFLWGLIKDAWDEVKQWWYDVAFEDGHFTIQGLLDGIWEKMKDIGTWILEHIFTPFIDGFKKAFGINSPSTVMYEQGGYIMEGLLNAISDMIHLVIEKWEEIKQKTKEKFDLIKESIKETFEKIKTDISEKLSETKEKIKEKIDETKKSWDEKWDGFKKKVSDIWDDIKETTSKAIEKVKGFIDGIMGKIQSVKDAVGSIWDFGSSLIGGVRNFFTPSFSNVPAYASGQVIPKTMSQHLAILGDNKHETEVVSPLSTMKQALSEVLATQNSNSPIVVQVMLDSKVVAESVVNQGKLRQASTGQNMFAF